MATITLKNIPEPLYERLKQAAASSRRSVNSEIIVCIERAVASRRVDVDSVLDEARRLRRWTEERPVRDEGFDRAKTEGRP
jgi:antitoxin FitA